MFNFKPRVYRSAEGCCICRAKSSSSRFTESQKYEEDFVKCFALKNPRRGQICNACVLLVKRYKRLPAGSERHWGHVVDARAGPGTKTLMKVKRHREEKNVEQAKSIISEKFTKIFKKSKKNKIQTLTPSSSSNQHNKQLPTDATPLTNSLDSDNEESSESSQELTTSKTNSPPTIVLFQTQTRASAFRSRHKINNSNNNNNKPIANSNNNNNKLFVQKSNILATTTTTTRKPYLPPKFSGSKKRKKFTPKKFAQPLDFDDKFKFFDEHEWVQQQTCCGIFYECAKLNGAVIIDIEQYKICQMHGQQQQQAPQAKQQQQIKTVDMDEVADKQQSPIALNMLTKPKCVIKATPLPNVVKLNLPLKGFNTEMKSTPTPTPALKKHHLYFKRQSESFPSAEDSTAAVETDDNENSTITFQQQQQHQQHADALSTSTLQTANITATPSTTTTTTTAAIVNTKSASFLHKIKSDTGRIVKHSFDKLNSAVRLKAHDLAEIKQLVKTVDRNYLLTKAAMTAAAATELPSPPPATAISATTSASTKFNDNSSDSGFDENVQERKSVSPLQQENDTKNLVPPSRPPVQTLILASGVRVHGQSQNLVYAGNETAAKILQNRLTKQSNQILQHAQRLNVNETAGTVKGQTNSVTTTTSSATLATLKLVQPMSSTSTTHKANPNCVVSIGPYGGLKMRALYNNNAIKHENGITTILPASSMAAANQANMNQLQAKAPNTITITPAAATATKQPPAASTQLALNAVNLQNRASCQ